MIYAIESPEESKSYLGDVYFVETPHGDDDPNNVGFESYRNAVVATVLGGVSVGAIEVETATKSIVDISQPIHSAKMDMRTFAMIEGEDSTEYEQYTDQRTQDLVKAAASGTMTVDVLQAELLNSKRWSYERVGEDIKYVSREGYISGWDPFGPEIRHIEVIEEDRPQSLSDGMMRQVQEFGEEATVYALHATCKSGRYYAQDLSDDKMNVVLGNMVEDKFQPYATLLNGSYYDRGW